MSTGLHVNSSFDSYNQGTNAFFWLCFSLKPVAARIGMRPVISEKYIEVFIGFEKDLDEIQQTYQTFKVVGCF